VTTREYQAQLREQIEEKKRLKSLEKCKTDLELEKELKAYAAKATQRAPQTQRPTEEAMPDRRRREERM
jgi:hypothetical protein